MNDVWCLICRKKCGIGSVLVNVLTSIWVLMVVGVFGLFIARVLT